MATDAPQFRVLSWLELCQKAWGKDFKKAEVVYEWSSGRKDESTDASPQSTLYTND
jgi:hypothetical protein